MKTKKSALGRGLSAILESPETDITSKDISGNYVVGAIANLAIEKIEANPFQPRDTFEEESLKQLAESIRVQGIIQPLTVRKLGYDKYQLISGERRFKASKIVGLQDVPCYIRVANDQQMLEMALIENIHRQDLNPIEIAISYNRLMEECNLTQEQLSKQVGKNRTTITNFLRLLKLPARIQLALRGGSISMGHARALINIENESLQNQMLDAIEKDGLSVREVEKLARENKPAGRATQSDSHQTTNPRIKEIETQLKNRFDSSVRIKFNNKGKGSIVIPFNSEQDIERILTLFNE